MEQAERGGHSVAVVIGLNERRHRFFVPVVPMLIAALAAVWPARATRSPTAQPTEGIA